MGNSAQSMEEFEESCSWSENLIISESWQECGNWSYLFTDESLWPGFYNKSMSLGFWFSNRISSCWWWEGN